MDFGVYVHIPYCKSVCPYCDFNVYVAKDAPWPRLLAALSTELEARAPAFAQHHSARSLYFGGGTPSLAPAELLGAVRDAVAARFVLLPEAEITVEVDPGTLDAQGFAALRAIGTTRLSMGWQSTHDHLLRTLGRGHNAAEARDALKEARRAGFDNVSLDLIFAVPGQSTSELEEDLDAIALLAPEHVSLYALTYHEGTPFARWRTSGRLHPVPEEIELAMMLRIEERLLAAGYEHYEVSNYAKPGYRSVHNSLYWSGAEYLGLGPGAHSFKREGFERGWRWEDVRAPSAYFAAWETSRTAGVPRMADASLSFVEELTPKQLISELFLVGLRRADGVDLTALPALADHHAIKRAAADAMARGWAQMREQRLVPTALGLCNADALASLFF